MYASGGECYDPGHIELVLMRGKGHGMLKI